MSQYVGLDRRIVLNLETILEMICATIYYNTWLLIQRDQCSHLGRDVRQGGGESTRRWPAGPFEFTQRERCPVAGHGRPAGKVIRGGSPETPRRAGGG
jgi:hypothetical protein